MIFNINIVTPHFKGIRQDRNTDEQLKKENQYDLNLPNQRKISNAIENFEKKAQRRRLQKSSSPIFLVYF